MKRAKRATFLTIERALDPSPPRNARPYWCYINTLIFYDKNHGEVWRQEIPEAMLSWCKTREDRPDEFTRYFHCEVFRRKHFGWQLRCTISHYSAEVWRNRMLQQVEIDHDAHFKPQRNRRARGAA